MTDYKQLIAIADIFEKHGNLQEAWIAVAELAHSKTSEPKHPIHTRLLALEIKMQADQASTPRSNYTL